MRAIVDAYLCQRSRIERDEMIGERLQIGELGAGGTGIGASELPSRIDEQFCGAGRPAKRCLIHAVELCNQMGTLQMWLSAAYSS